MATGQYTGDGTTSNAITGLGFRPKFVMIFRHVTAQTLDHSVFSKMDQFYSNLCYAFFAGDFLANRIISLDPDGFTVSDAGADADPNTNGQLYDYVAWG